MLDKVVISKCKEFSGLAVVIMDTTYFGRGFGVMVFKNSLDGVVLYKQYVRYETNALYLAGISEISRYFGEKLLDRVMIASVKYKNQFRYNYR